MGVILVLQGLCWGRGAEKGLPSLHSLPEDAEAAEELHCPPSISSQTGYGGKVHSGKFGAVGHTGLLWRSRVRGLGSSKALTPALSFIKELTHAWLEQPPT